MLAVIVPMPSTLMRQESMKVEVVMAVHVVERKTGVLKAFELRADLSPQVESGRLRELIAQPG